MRPPAATTVDAYRNLSRNCWSARVGGRVVGHVESLVLLDARFVVSVAGVRRVQTRLAREVVAFVRGVLTESGGSPRQAVRVRFCPYRGPDFTLEDGSPVSAAVVVILAADGSCWAVDPT